jgi:hypothetical protein
MAKWGANHKERLAEQSTNPRHIAS